METTDHADRHPSPLWRSSTDRWLGGVCGGLARWLGWSSTTVRVLVVAASVLSAGFPGTAVYLVLWLVMPRDATPA
jgi:phage shock protein PspC (stress-responsive transcriptional regulator)